MARLHQNDQASLVLNHRPTAAGDASFKLWSSCRRKIIDTMRCSGGMSRHRKTPVAEDVKTTIPECRSDRIKESEKLATLVKMPEYSSSEEKMVTLKETVKRLQGGEDGDVLRGVKEVRELAKGDSNARTEFALLGAIPPLVALLDSEDLNSQISALYAILNIGIGNDLNKSAIVKAGAVHKMLALIESPMEGAPHPDLTAAIIANFLGLSALDLNKSIIGSSGAISFMIKTLKSTKKADTNSQVVHDSLRALYNLSILPSNVLLMIEVNGSIPFLMTTIGADNEIITDRILSILTNIVSTSEGRHAISTTYDAFTIFVDVLSWMDSPNCQEKVTYILLVMAYKSNEDHQAMIQAGMNSSLLELTLLGSTLAQKRSSRILKILGINKGKQVSKSIGDAGATISAPLCESTGKTESVYSSSGFLNTNAIKDLVEQSLHNNMRKIVKRANLQLEFSEHLKSSVASYSSSKSLPF